ncbi:transposase [Pannus brasiliensis CCIBt3594]|uniref:Transposase n=1 Tax=Pannus brasiliensis CCIBt3594 TaxID=1427578 RepID=A0AAW9QJW4_9CHRO
MRVLTKPSTARCDVDKYTYFLLSEPKGGGCCRLAEVLGISRHSSNRFLSREEYTPLDLFEEVKKNLNLKGGVLSADDTVVEKRYSDPKRSELIGYYWSGKYRKAIVGLNLITLYYTEPAGKSLPINYRLYNPVEKKTKNEYVREMIEEVIEWGVEPSMVTADSWYSSRENLQFFKDRKLGFQLGIAKNRLLREMGGQFERVENLEIPESGKIVELKGFGKVKVFRRTFKDKSFRHYITFLNDESELENWTRDDFRQLQNFHWGIERYHRALKQLCGLSKFQVRKTEAITTHVFCSLRAFCFLESLRARAEIDSWYAVQKQLYLKVVKEFILANLSPSLDLLA